MAICDNMKAIRRKKGMTQKQVAEACGLADSTISTYELGNANPKYEIELMDQDEGTKGGAVDSSHRCIESATEQIIDVMLKHFASLAPDRRIPPDRFLGKEYLKHMK